ncbi:GNAT family N-acetyltransferase [Micromonospora sp. NPDC126480]|uniref:GNAT family N-acetyltransferase n=1 Tax=Micromonospora sp. NPDC126480 TaxID=3155312 RepID=UPI00333054E5
MVDVITRTMTQAEFDDWQRVLARQFADEQVAAGVWSADEAYDLARQGNTARLPDGLATPEMLLLRGLREDRTPIGRLWIGLLHPRGVPGCAFLYDIEVDREFRGLGYGRALLRAGESVAKRHGAEQLELNVFGGNATAIALYSSSGYRVVTQQMRKSLPQP